MKVILKASCESKKAIIGQIEDVEMYEKVNKKLAHWNESAYVRITHIRIPKEVFERLLDLDRKGTNEKKNDLTPCDFCYFEPSSSGGEYPCVMCPAQLKKGGFKDGN